MYASRCEHFTTTDDGNCLRLRWVFASLEQRTAKSTEHNTLYVILNVVTYSWHVPISIVAFCFASSCTHMCVRVNVPQPTWTRCMYCLPFTHAPIYSIHIAVVVSQNHTKHTVFRVLPKMNILTFSICDDITSLFISKWRPDERKEPNTCALLTYGNLWIFFLSPI